MNSGLIPSGQRTVAPFHKILFPADFSDASNAMALEVRSMVSRCKAVLTVLHSFNVVRQYNLAGCPDPAGFDLRAAIPYGPEIAGLREREQLQLENFACEQFGGLTYKAVMEDGEPAAVICMTASREQTDLIMLPTKGRGTFRRLLLGSVTAKVLHDADCSVFTSAHECDPPRPQPHGYRVILCAVELNQQAESILRTAAGLAQLWDAQLSVIHVAHHESADSDLDGLLRSAGVVAPVLIRDARVPGGIKRVAVERSADLVVVGRGKDRGRISRIFSELYEIVRESPCPVLSV